MVIRDKWELSIYHLETYIKINTNIDIDRAYSVDCGMLTQLCP